MKKKLSLFLVAFIAMAAYAVQFAVNATKSVTELTVISEATTWDFSKLTINKESARYNSKDDAIKLDENTTPSINDEVIYADYADADITIPAEFNADAIAFKGQYPIRKNKYSQNGELHFKTSVPGNIIVKFSDTGSTASATAVKRYLVVNGEQTDYWASRENNGDEPYAAQLNVTTDEIAVPAGDVVIKGTSAIQVSYISFTPSEEPQPAEASYYVVGTMNDWKASDAYKLATNAATEGEYMTTLQLAKDDELKVIKVEGETTTWYPDGMDNNLKVKVSGEYDIYFRPDGQGGQDWHNGYIYLALKDEPAVSYTVHLDDGQVNGTVEADKYDVAENEQVLLKVTPNDGYDIDQVNVATATGATIDIQPIVGGEYHYSFVMPGEDVYVSATFKEQAEVSPYEKATSIAVGDVVVLTAEGSTKDGPYAKELSNLTGKIGEVADYTNVPTGTIELTVEAGKQDGTFAFKCSEGKYLAANNSNELPLKDAVENASSWTVTWTEGVPIITNVDQTERVLQYNSGSPRFACYKGTQKAVTLWKKVGVEPQPLVIESMVIVGDFLGLENTGETSDPNWDPANGWQMTQSEENPAIWTYVKEGFEAEAKKYEFKATANGNWKDYVLPARTNADFIFGTEDYPAGTYDLTFTVNTDENILSLDVEKAEEPVETYTATFTTNLGWKPVYAYAYNYTPADEAEGVQEHFYEPVEWPGTPMTLNAETGVYEVAIESAEEPNLIIFNDGTKEGSQVGINKTPNWEFENGKAYDYSTQPFAVSFTTDKKWDKVYAYIWKGGIEAPVQWPGVEITETKDGDTYYHAFQSTYAPDFIIFNNGLENEAKEQTSDLVFEDGANYSLTTEKTTAWAGDPEVAIPTTTGITIPAKAFEKADVQAEKIIHIVAKEISTAAPAKGFNSDVAELKPTDIAILKNEEPFDKVLIEETAIQVVDDGYQFVADNAVAQEITDHGFIIKPLGDKQIGVEYVEVEQAKAPAAVVNIDFAPAPTDDIGAVIEARAAEITAAGNKVGNITITLGAIGTPYTTTKAIVAPAGVLIQGAGPATSIIDASGLEGNLIQMAATYDPSSDPTPTEWTVADVTVKNVAIKGLKKALFYSTQKMYVANDFVIDNCIVELAADATTIDYTKGSTAKNITVTNSTIYAPTATTKAFYSSQSGQKYTEYDTTAEAMQTFKFHGNTMYNLAPTKNFFTHRQNNQKWLAYDVENNIFVNCGKSGQVIKGMNGGAGGANPTWTIIGNAFNFDGADTSAAESTGDTDHTGDETPGLNETVQNSVAGVVAFTDVATGDFNGVFTLAEGAEEPATKLGDPRWTITYATPVVITTMSIVGEFTGGWPVQDPETSAWDWSMAKAMTQDAENANIWTLEMPFVAEAKKYEYKAAANSNWNDYVLPLSENANFIFGTDEYPAGEYILTFTADTKNHTVGVVAKWNGPEDIKVVPEEGSDISTAVQTASEGKKVKDIYVYLAPGKKFTISKSIVAPAAFVIMGAADGTNPSDIDENATMAEIDASALDGPMVLMSETPAVAADANGFYPLADVGFLNVKVTGLAQQLFYANKQKYLINCFHVDFCNINIAGGSKTIIDTNGGGVIATLDMSKNTIWANPENTGALYSSQSGDKATAAGLAVQTFNIEKNTMYNIAKGKNFCSHRQSNQTWLTYNVKNNTFVNCGKSGQVIKGLNGGSSGANPTWNVDGNAFNFDGADTSANEETGDADEPVKNSLAGVFTFTDATAGDFNGVFKSDAAEAPAKYPGDPRWTYTYESTAPAKFYLIGSMNGWDRTALTEMTFNETTQAYEYEYAPTEKVWFAFADKQLTAEEATADPEWADFNANHRYAIGAGDVNATLNEAIALQKVNGTLVLEAGSYKISVAKDLSTVTITGEAPETTYTVAGSFYYADGSVAIFGTEWDVANTANDMEKQLDGTYKKVYTIDFPFAGNIQFKVAENHAWDVSYGWDVTAENPDGNAFYNVASPANGATVTITFDPNGATAADKVKIEVTGIPTVGINGIVTDDADDNAPIYNLAGQKVDKNYKGVVIKNGKKIYQK